MFDTVREEAEESLREANARADAGTGTQLDVLDAENQLTQARSTQSPMRPRPSQPPRRSS